ncbi:hypothetical protein MIND_00651700 [Mycena indigotica]|uniref:DUF6534 domain-containing protein n=1 Tax=Mycena indigotica TaxID=2126181 RepID=A0A8H6ST31_9AGAR|nr:uncharacterized protein MIND_00651700 [Mycena indigotica]KAF7304196.1 hypothetical protein MIND_00651700 [Mycena indigotica]
MSFASAFFPPGVTLDNLFGAAFIGFALSCLALGICTNQAVTYFSRYPGDRPAYKLLVVLVWVLAVIDQAFIGHAVYFYTITNYANPLILMDHVAWTLIVQLTVGAVVGTIVRLCFAMRVWRFSQRNIPVTAMLILLTIAEMALAIVYTVKVFQNPFLTVLPKLKLTASLALGFAAFTDVVIACSLAFFLRKYRTGSKRADTLVKSLTVYAVNTGAITAAVSICTLVFYDLYPTTFKFLAFYFILCKVYAISFFCTLNTRRIIRGKGTERSDGRSDGHTGPSGATAGRAPISTGPRSRFSMTGLGQSMVTGGNGSVNAYGPGFGLGRSKSGSGTTGHNLEIGVHQEVSVSSDVDEIDFRETKDDMELSPTLTSPTYAYGSRVGQARQELTGPGAYAYSRDEEAAYGGRERAFAYGR